jgi:hypothetical protein
MPSVKERHSTKHNVDEAHEEHTHEEVASSQESGSGSEGSEEEEEEDDEEDEEDGSEVNIDLSDNDFYKGMCTLLEDDNGNNIVKYIDLLCEHTKEIGDNVKHLEGMRQDIHRIAKSFEKLVSLQEQFMSRQMGAALPPVPPQQVKREHHSTDDVTVKSVKKSSSTGESSRSDDATVKSSKTQKSSKH